MRIRPSSRLLVLDPTGRILLFRFVHLQGALAGQDFWATPGGGLEDGETFEQAAIRELAEETGIRVNDVGPEISRRKVEFQLPDGARVISDERYFMIRIDDLRTLSRDGWTAPGGGGDGGLAMVVGGRTCADCRDGVAGEPACDVE